MKKSLLTSLVVILITSQLFAQNSSTKLGNAVQYFNNLIKQHNRFGSQKTISIDNKDYRIDFKQSNAENIVGILESKGSFLLLTKKNNQVSGQLVLSEKDSIAYKYETDSRGDLVLTKVSIDEVLCVSYGNHSVSNENENFTQNLKFTAAPKGTLQSLPGCPYVIMIDFDGFNLPAGTPWNNGAARTINGVNYSDVDEERIWNNVKEDYSPFQVNITTSEAVYLAADPKKRMKVVVTRDEITPGGGVAIINSFGNEATKCCWAYPNKLRESILSVAECVSHEAGHTLGLKHDGAPSTPDYYEGHNGWAPIMGNSYTSFVTQWSKGEYTGANNKQDDLVSITGYIPYKIDDHGNSNASATELKYTLGSDGVASVLANENAGIIERNTDVDVFHFYLSGGQINLLIKPTGTPRTNLDIQAIIFDKNGNKIQQYNTTHSAGSSTVPTSVINGFTISKSLPKGDYYLQIDGVGSGDPTTGWSDYNSMGQYAISGTIVGIEQKNYDIGIEAIDNIYEMNCGNNITPQIQVINSGKLVLTSFDVEVFIDGISTSKQTIITNIVSGVKKTFALNPISITNFGTKTIKIVVSNPSGNADEIPVNNELTKVFKIGDGGLFQFSISTLSKEKTLSWKITSGSTVITDNTKNAAVVSGDKEVTGFCLATNKCYTFELTNAFKENTCAKYPAWNSTTQYKAGDIVIYQGNVYKAKSDIWTVDPTSAWYTLVGPCPVVNVNDNFTLTNVAENKIVADVKYSTYVSPYKVDFCTSTILTDLENEKFNQFSVYPNPTTGTIWVNTPMEILSIFVFTLEGKLVFYQNGNNTNFDISHLSNGMYLLKLSTREGDSNRLIIKK